MQFMDDPVSNAIVAQWRELREVAANLVADLTDEQMVGQPVAGVTMNHPAWVLSHLSATGWQERGNDNART